MDYPLSPTGSVAAFQKALREDMMAYVSKMQQTVEEKLGGYVTEIQSKMTEMDSQTLGIRESGRQLFDKIDKGRHGDADISSYCRCEVGIRHAQSSYRANSR